MTKKDYILIANTIKDTSKLYPEAKQSFQALAVFFCSQLEAENSLFNREKFLTACGVSHAV